MKSKLSMKILGVVVTVATVASLLVGITAAPVSAAAPGALVWATTDTPSNVNNVLGGDSYPGGTLTAIGNPHINLMAASPDGKAIFAWDDANKTLYKSADGMNWNTSVAITTVTAGAVALKVSLNFATDNAVALATPNEVWLSTNGGASFVSVAPTDLLTKLGTTPSTITSLDLGYWYTTSNVLTMIIGTKGALAGAGVATSHVLSFVSGGFAWSSIANAATAPAGTGPGLSANDVYGVKFSPSALTDGEIMAVYYNPAATATTPALMISSDFGTLGWNNPAYPDSAVAGKAGDLLTAPPTSVQIALPSDYVGNTGASIIVGLNGGTLAVSGAAGDVYRVSGRASGAGSYVKTGLAANVYSLAISGPMATATVFAGQFGSTVSRTTTITTSTITWSGSKYITGTSPSLALAGAALYAGTSGADSAVNVSNDGGVSFQQVGLIDCTALVGGALTVSLVNFTAVDDNTMFLVMANTAAGSVLKQYVFKTTNAGVNWMRIYTTTVAVGASTFLPPSLQVSASTTYATDSTVVIADGSSAIQKSTNGGMTWSPVGTPATAVTALWVTDGNNIFVGNSTGGVYKIGVFSISTGLPASPVVSFAMNPKDATKATLMVGLANGTVWESTNNGVSFVQIGTAAPGGANPAFVAYGPDGTRYAAITISGGVFDYLTGTGWTTTVTAGATATTLNNATGVAVATGGALYASDAVATNSVFRTLNPTATTPTVTQLNFVGSGFTATTGTALDLNVVSGTAANNVYIIDSGVAAGTTYLYAGRIRGFSDTMMAAPAITAPKTGTVLTTTTFAALSWPAVTGATDYQISIDGNAWTSVGNVTSYTVSSATAPYTGLPSFNQGETHTWSVRVDAVNTPAVVGSFYSTASAAASFILALVQPPVVTVQNPTQGATGVDVNTTFTWPASAVAGATYEFVIAEELGNADKFAIIDYAATSPTNATALRETLKYNTIYWWRVRTVTATSKSDWTTSFFTTESAPVVTTSTTPPVLTTTVITVTQPPSTTITFTNPPAPASTPVIPSYLLWAVIAVGAVLVIAVIVLIVRTRRIP